LQSCTEISIDESALEDTSFQELVALAALAAFGCGLALAMGDLLFATIFGVASAVTIKVAAAQMQNGMFHRDQVMSAIAATGL
jgi:hypothetical protein